MGLFDKMFGTYSERELKHIYPIRDEVIALEKKYEAMTDDELRATTPVLKERLKNGETLDNILPDAFALCREASWRVLGMKHFPVQIIGGIVLHQGRISEMRTGEGKTLVATLPVFLNGLSGEGVHVVTVNDYLAKRDSEWMGKLYNFLGLSVGLVVSGLNNSDKKRAYECDIVYGTNNEFGFDYLRDNMATYKVDQVQRGHVYAVVDEVDSILIDEARTPLIISGQGDKSTDLYGTADKFARQLRMLKVKEMNDKEEQDDLDGDYIIDEKARTCNLTATGVKKAEKFFNVENLADAENMTISHHINQAIRAHGLMKRDIDYVIKDGEIIIVDEFTGRLMIGRRYNEGLHQAIEAKEGVEVARESKTLATITFQNYFRMYKKLAGMTGTALTEESEFREIYKLDVIEIPTNRDIARLDYDDSVYKSENGKLNAVIEQAAECHAKGQPVLVGTVSIEKSELLSSMLKRKGIKHEVLNAKYHEKEAEIVAQAGKFGAVTIATNMAGRGTDIVLGGNAEFLAKAEMRKNGYDDDMISEAIGYSKTEDEEILKSREIFKALHDKYKDYIKEEAEKVKDAGGLFIIGTERHESRRIDNQLRGRAGRQGDPGMTRFYLSLEDDLMRLFGGDKIQGLMDTLKIDEDLPIEAKILSGTIQSAQSKVEGRNFGIRKSVLQFDDVMNKQREIIYGQRAKVLDGDDLTEIVSKMLNDVIANGVKLYIDDTAIHDDWNINGLREYFKGWLCSDSDFHFTNDELTDMTSQTIIDMLEERARKLYAEREAKFTPDMMREIERVVLLKNVDTKWMDHIDAMDELKRGIYLRSYGQKDPVVEYRIEGFEMFDALIDSIREDTAKMLMTVQIRTNDEPKREQVAKPTTATHGDGTVAREPVKVGDKTGRNDPCPCGSGKKYKKCCGQ